MSEALPNDAFVGFYQRSAPALWAYLARVSGNPAVTDDLNAGKLSSLPVCLATAS
jgi:hypothetical protein